jgi:alkylhydroperoxidase/carboxymuconolactone decarboxylase family protein YurZ
MSTKMPGRFQRFEREQPRIIAAYTALGDACQGAGPLTPTERVLVKLGVAIGMQHEGAVHSHTRKALAAGASPAAIRHAALLATTTIGFPRMMAALSWIDDVLAAEESGS